MTICFTRELPHLNKHAALSLWFLASGQIFTKDDCAARILLRFKTTPASNVIWKGKNLSIVAVSERHLRRNGDPIFGGSVFIQRHVTGLFPSTLLYALSGVSVLTVPCLRLIHCSLIVFSSLKLRQHTHFCFVFEGSNLRKDGSATA